MKKNQKEEMTRFMRFFVCLFFIAIATPAFAAGYNCPTTLQYTSCASGYYMTRTTTTTDKTYYGTIVSGNDCKLCSTLGTVSTTNGITCPGGSGTTGEPTVTCAAGKYWNGSSCTTCTAGYACAGFSNVKISSMTTTYGRSICTGATYSSSGKSSCTPCPTGYTASTGSGKTAPSSCTINCAAGTRIVNAYDTSCTTPAGPWYAYSHSVNYGSVSNVFYCMKGYDYNNSLGPTDPSQHIDETMCTMSVPAGNYIPTAGLKARYIGLGSTRGHNEYGDTMVAQIEAYSDYMGGTNYLSGKGGIEGTDLTNATNGDYSSDTVATCSLAVGDGGKCVWDIGRVETIRSIAYAMGSDGGIWQGVTIAVSEDGVNWTVVADEHDVPTATNIFIGNLVGVSGVATNCGTGKSRQSHMIMEGGTSTCTTCSAGTYSRVTNAATCTPCAIGSYNTGTGNISCTACSAGTTTTATGGTSCSNCSNKNTYVTSWTAPSWTTSNTVNNVCKISGCSGGYWSNNNAACAAAGSAYYSPAGSISRSSCPTGYTAGSTTKASQDQCSINCSPGTRVVSPGEQCTTPSGDWYTYSTTNTTYGNVSYIEMCPAGFHAPGTAATGHDNAMDCVASVPGGKYVKKGISGRYFRIRSSTSPTLVSVVDVYDDQWNQITYNVSTGTGTNLGNATNSTWDLNQYATCPTTGCIWDMGSVKNVTHLWFEMGGTNKTYSNVEIHVSEDGSTWKPIIEPMDIVTGLRNSNPGMMEISEMTNCAAGTAQASHSVALTDISECAACSAGKYSLAGAASCTSCAVGSYNTGSGNSACIPCQNGTTTSAVGQTSCNANCAGKVNTSTWNTASWATNNTVSNICFATACLHGYLITNNTCTPITLDCPAGQFMWHWANKTVCEPCHNYYYCPGGINIYGSGAVGAANSAGVVPILECPSGYKDNMTYGKSTINQCGKNCTITLPTDGYITSTNFPSMVSYPTVCPTTYTITGCEGGYYRGAVSDTKCSNVSSGYWSAAGEISRNACTSGLTTIGYGAGADEAADCGRILNFGSNKLYLRSAKKTTPSLNINIGGTTYYGNMSTDTSWGNLRLNSSGTTYSVYDDSIGGQHTGGGI